MADFKRQHPAQVCYGYDELNRLSEASYQKPGAVPVPNSYGESASYDKNGNIKSMDRYGEFDDGVVALKIDQLAYGYQPNSNRLAKVTDATNNPNGFRDDSDGTNDDADDYAYDAYGNMLSDANKGISLIAYNHLHLPVKIIMAAGNIEYLYDAAGRRLRKTVSENAKPVKTQDYLSGLVYSNGVLEVVPTSEGYVKNTVVAGVNSFNYVYNYTDHLGNVRLSYGQDPATLAVKVLEESNYYPFGLKHKNYNMSEKVYKKTGGGVSLDEVCVTCPVPYKYNYKYNGKEYQDELGLNLYDYGARNYDPAIGRWMNIDPKAELLERSSPYVYALNSPVIYVDKDGELPILINGKTASDSERADVSYWTSGIVNTIKNSGIANPGGEIHYVDGNRGHSWHHSVGGHATKYDNPTAPSRRAQGGRYAAKEDWSNILSKLARDPATGKIIEKIQIYTHSRGGAFGIGYTEKLLELIKENASQFADANNVIDFVFNMAPHQSDYLTAPNGVRSYSMDHDRDKLSDNDMSGLKGAFTSNEKSGGFFGAHSITSFNNDLKAFTSAFLKGGTSQDVINNFISTMKKKYDITVTVNTQNK